MFKEFKTLDDLQKAFPNEQSCVDHLEQYLWKGKTPKSPFDPTSKVFKCADQITKSKYPVKYTRFQCGSTKKYFNVKTGTIFENTKLPLKTWFIALFVLSTDKRGIPSTHLPNYVGMTQKTAWFILHRLRNGFDCPLFKTVLGNIVEIDETYIGGKNKNRHWDKKVPRCQGRSSKDKTPTLVMMEEGGRAIAEVVPNVKQKTLEPIVKKYVKEGSDVSTDEWLAYRDLFKWYNHGIVNHGKGEHVNGKTTVNSAENFNSQLKRMIIGTYRKVERKHTQRYVNELTFRFNTRNYNNQDRFDLVLLSSVGKRLTYQELTS